LKINQIWKVLNELKNEKNNEFYYSKNSIKLEEDSNIIALVSDAGTPGISDPAFEVLKIAQELGINYTTLPGATAVIPAVVNSNLITKEFLFLGFLPLKKGRMTEWKRIANSQTPVVIYESCHRIKKFLEEVRLYLNLQTKICINQEISKSHENIWVGTVDQVQNYTLVEKGEFVIVIRN
jgi:16S rRNA (cytidine1402-2'-O)-methyltransferase